jgi:hypothetical protein
MEGLDEFQTVFRTTINTGIRKGLGMGMGEESMGIWMSKKGVEI